MSAIPVSQAAPNPYAGLSFHNLNDRWRTLVAEKREQARGNLAQAIVLANRANPALREALVAAANAGR